MAVLHITKLHERIERAQQKIGLKEANKTIYHQEMAQIKH